MDFLEFTFRSFWHFIGVIILIAVVGEALADIVRAFFKDKQ